MIEGYGLKLTQPRINYRKKTLMTHPEIQEMLKSIREYFNQENIIYDAYITLTNNEYETIIGEYGAYKRRKDITFCLRYLIQIDIYKDKIIFKTVDEDYQVNVGKDFLYFLEWESNYYK